MSAYVVSKEHIDALVTGAHDLNKSPHSSTFRWFTRATTEEKQEARVPGVAISSGDMELVRQHCRTLGQEATEGQAGAMLWAENARSVNFRYNEEEWEEPYTFKRAYPLGDLSSNVVRLLKAIDCYEYQTCETPDWEETEAHSFITSLRHQLIARLPGYNDADWGWKAP